METEQILLLGDGRYSFNCLLGRVRRGESLQVRGNTETFPARQVENFAVILHPGLFTTSDR